METIFTILLIIHIIAGSIGLLTGTINIIKKKGDKAHKNVGKFFFYSMLINGFAGLIMSLIHRNDFLLIVAVFSIYMVATGQRFLSLKQLNKEQNVQECPAKAGFSTTPQKLNINSAAGNQKNNNSKTFFYFCNYQLLIFNSYLYSYARFRTLGR